MQRSFKKGSSWNGAALVLTIFTMCLVSAEGFAQSEAGPASLTLFGGQGFGGTFETDAGIDIELDDDVSLGFIFDYDQNRDTQWEVIYLRHDTMAETQDVFASRPLVNTEIQYFQGGGTYRGGREKVRPYLAGTLGLTRIDPSGANTESDTFWSISIGGGVQFEASERLGFRLEGRVFGTAVTSNSAIFCGSSPAGGQCLVRLEGDMLWQSHVFAGVTFRF